MNIDLNEVQRLTEEYLSCKQAAEDVQPAFWRERFMELVRQTPDVYEAYQTYTALENREAELKQQAAAVKKQLSELITYAGEEKLQGLPKGVAQAVYSVVEYEEAEATAWALSAGDLGASVLQLNKKGFEKLVEGMPEAAAQAVGIPARVVKWVKARIS